MTFFSAERNPEAKYFFFLLIILDATKFVLLNAVFTL